MYNSGGNYTILMKMTLTKKNSFWGKKNGQGIIYIFRFLDLPKVRKIKGYNFLRFFTWMLDFVYFFYLKFGLEDWNSNLKLKFKLDLNLKIELSFRVEAWIVIEVKLEF